MIKNTKVCENILEAIGNTPMVKLSHVGPKDGADIYVAVPNGRNVSLIDLPKGSYSMEKLNK